MHARTHPGNRRYVDKVAVVSVVSVAMLLAACSAATSPTASQHLVAASQSQPSTAASSTALPSAAGTSVPSAPVTTVTIRDRSFGAPEITIAVGTVAFVNADTLPHTVTEGQNGVAAPNARFNQVVGVGESVEVTFPDPGDYQITCLFHGEMHLLVHAH